MEMPLAVVTALNATLQRLFAANEEARDQLQRHTGGVITVTLREPGITLHVMVLEHSLECLTVWDDEPDATVQTDVAGLMALSRGTDALLSGDVRVRGDLRLVEGVHRAVALLAADWEDQLAPIVGDTLAHKLATGVRRVASGAKRNRARDIEDTVNYLQDEAKLLATRADWRHLTDTSDELRQCVDRLSARLDLLARSK